MVEAAIIVSTILSILGEGARQIITDIKDRKQITIDEARRVINKAVNHAYQKSNQLGEKLSNRLMSISLIQKTPALQQAINKLYDETKQKQQDLKNDIAEIEFQQARADDAYANASDASIFRKRGAMNELSEVNKDVQEKISQIEKRIE